VERELSGSSIRSAPYVPPQGAIAPWVAEFHDGNRGVLEQCYRDHARAVLRAVSRLLEGADAETVTHDVFYRLLSNARLRQNFQGGRFEAWLTQVATNAAHDYRRRYRRERPETTDGSSGDDASREEASEADARITVGRFQRERLPLDLAGVFEARFLRQLSQREAAHELGVPRTTLVYQEQRVRALLERFVFDEAS
jgi:RNA polymerase sigma-70 factor (ECF subfamily)